MFLGVSQCVCVCVPDSEHGEGAVLHAQGQLLSVQAEGHAANRLLHVAACDEGVVHQTPQPDTHTHTHADMTLRAPHPSPSAPPPSPLPHLTERSSLPLTASGFLWWRSSAHSSPSPWPCMMSSGLSRSRTITWGQPGGGANFLPHCHRLERGRDGDGGGRSFSLTSKISLSCVPARIRSARQQTLRMDRPAGGRREEQSKVEEEEEQK